MSVNGGWKEALHRVLDALGRPTFNSERLESELKVVDSEHARNVTDPTWRSFETLKLAGNQAHPYNWFSTGTSETMYAAPKAAGMEPLDIVRAFHKKYYLSANMSIAVVGPDSLESMREAVERWVNACIPTTDAPRARFQAPSPLLSHTGCKLVRLVELGERSTVSVYWQIPPDAKHWTSSPASVLAHAIGHEGKGSLLSYLRAKNWATGCMAGPALSLVDETVFYVSFDVTAAGMEYWQDVVRAVYQYVALLRHSSDEQLQRVCRDNAAEQMLSVKYATPQEAFGTATSLAERLLDPFLPNDMAYLHRFAAWTDVDMSAMRATLDALVPAGSIVLLRSNSSPVVLEHADLVDKYYKLKYGQASVPEDLCLTWSSAHVIPELQLPPKNEFIPDDFTRVVPCLKSAGTVSAPALDMHGPDALPALTKEVARWSALAQRSVHDRASMSNADLCRVATGVVVANPIVRRAAQPILLEDGAGTRITWTPDYWNDEPRATMHMDVCSPTVYAGTRAHVLIDLAVRALTDMLAEFLYDAYLVDMSQQVTPAASGLQISAGGWSSKLPLLITRIMEYVARMADPSQVDMTAVQRAHTTALRDIDELLSGQPYSLARLEAGYVFTLPRMSMAEKRAVLQAGVPTREEVAGAMAQFLSTASVAAHVHGNVTADQARELVRLVTVHLPTARSGPWPGLRDPRRSLTIPSGLAVRRVLPAVLPDTRTCCVDMHWMCGVANNSTLFGLQVLATVLHDAAYAQLRTVENLGYVVFGLAHVMLDTASLELLVESDSAPPAHVEQRMRAFMAGFGATLEALPQEELVAIVQHKLLGGLRAARSLTATGSYIARSMLYSTAAPFRVNCTLEDVGEFSKWANREKLLGLYRQYIAPAAGAGMLVVVQQAGCGAAAGEAAPAGSPPLVKAAVEHVPPDAASVTTADAAGLAQSEIGGAPLQSGGDDAENLDAVEDNAAAASETHPLATSAEHVGASLAAVPSDKAADARLPRVLLPSQDPSAWAALQALACEGATPEPLAGSIVELHTDAEVQALKALLPSLPRRRAAAWLQLRSSLPTAAVMPISE